MDPVAYESAKFMYSIDSPQFSSLHHRLRFVSASRGFFVGVVSRKDAPPRNGLGSRPEVLAGADSLLETFPFTVRLSYCPMENLMICDSSSCIVF